MKLKVAQTSQVPRVGFTVDYFEYSGLVTLNDEFIPLNPGFLGERIKDHLIQGGIFNCAEFNGQGHCHVANDCHEDDGHVRP